MSNNLNQQQKSENNVEMKLTFLSNAISDISTYIQLADTKVSIIMGAVVAILVGISSCYEPIFSLADKIYPCSWRGVSLILLSVFGIINIILVFIFGLLTIRGHSSVINYQSKWFLPKSTKEYSFEEFTKDVKNMADNDIINNMTAELYKLNDINRQKMKTMKWTILTFALLLIAITITGLLLLGSLI